MVLEEYVTIAMDSTKQTNIEELRLAKQTRPLKKIKEMDKLPLFVTYNSEETESVEFLPHGKLGRMTRQGKTERKHGGKREHMVGTENTRWIERRHGG